MRYWYDDDPSKVDFSKTTTNVRVVTENGEYNARFTGPDATKLAVEHASSIVSSVKNKKIISISIETDVYLTEDQSE